MDMISARNMCLFRIRRTGAAYQTQLWFLPGERGIRLIVYLTEMIELHECRDCFQWVDREREEDCQDNIMNGN